MSTENGKIMNEKEPPSSMNGNGHVAILPSKNGRKITPPLEYDLLDPPAEIMVERVEAITRHIHHVQASCILLGNRLIESGEKDIGLKLIANGLIHDNSKFHGVEWHYLHNDVKIRDPEAFSKALLQHTTSNPHHPEYWDDISEMPRVYVAEMICDWHGRSSEFGTALREFVKEKATKKYDFTLQSKIYKDIKYFLEMLLDPAFQ